jgi:signal peptidase I
MVKKFFIFLWEIIQTVLLAFLIVLPIRYFVFQPFLVQGQSMEPNFHQGDYLLVDELSFRFREPRRGEVIVFRYPPRPQLRYIKRIIGLPGDEVVIKNGLVLINGKILDESEYLPQGTQTQGYLEIKLGENEYFVLGDNRNASSDSRFWGPLKKENIIGRVFFRAWPFSALAKIEIPAY